MPDADKPENLIDTSPDKPARDAVRQAGITIHVHNGNVVFQIENKTYSITHILAQIAEMTVAQNISKTISKNVSKTNTLSGDFRGAAVFNDSTINNAGTIAGSLAGMDDVSREALRTALRQIGQALAARPAEKADDADAVAVAAEDFLRESGKGKPNPKRLRSLGDAFIGLAADVVSFAPTVVDLAKRVVEMVSSAVT